MLVFLVTIPVGTLAAVLISPQAAAVAFVIGWFFLVPVIPVLALLFRVESKGEPETEDPFETLKQQYASGEITEAELNERLEQLLEVEELEAQQVSTQETERVTTTSNERETN